ncbi:MAG: hypothetical protein LBR91_01120, partial [Puniceicoccales bacterium]|nr:hypothetical protein [Puniceicoccales bacterium]
IEKFWAKLKRKLRDILPLFSSLGDALYHAFCAFLNRNCYNSSTFWFTSVLDGKHPFSIRSTIASG